MVKARTRVVVVGRTLVLQSAWTLVVEVRLRRSFMTVFLPLGLGAIDG